MHLPFTFRAYFTQCLRRIAVVHLILGLILGVAVQNVAATTAAKSTLTLGIFAYRPKAILAPKFQELGIYLTGALPHHQVVIEILDQKEMEDALQANRLDFVFTNPSHFVVLRHSNRLSGAIATVQSRENGLSTASLGGVILAPANRKDIQSLSDLAGKRIAIPGQRYLGGYQTQAFELFEIGINPKIDAQLIEVGSHDKVVDALLAGQADAGFVRTGILEALSREGKRPLDRLKILAPRQYPNFPYMVSTRLYPEWAFSALPHVPPDVVKRMARALFFLTEDMPPAEAADIGGFSIPGDYQSIDQLARTLRLPPYETPEFRLTDIWARYQWTLVIALLSIVFVVLLSIRLWTGNRRLRQERAKLSQSERRLKLIAEGANLGLWDWRPATQWIELNSRILSLLGYAPSEREALQGQWFHIDHPEDRTAYHQALEAHFAKATERYSCRRRLQHKDGHWVWVLDAGQVTEWDSEGKPSLMRGILIDITEAKSAELALRDREDRLRTLVRSMDDVVLVLDTNGRIAECHWPESDEKAPDTLSWINQDCSIVLPPELAQSVGDVMGRLIVDPEHPVHQEFSWHLSDGERWYSAIFSALKNPEDAYPKGFLCIARDITGRKYEELALKESRNAIEQLSRRNQLLLEAAGEGIYGVDQDGRINFINPSALAMLELGEADAIGKNSHDLFHRSSLDGMPRPLDQCPVHQTLLDGRRREAEEIYVRRTGEAFVVHLVATPVIDEGRQLGVEVVFLDITPRKTMEAELTRLATTDSLTGVSNRRHFLAQVEDEIARFQRFGQPVSILMLDLDRFKRINDTYGHPAGDAVLKVFAETMREACRRMDHIGRLGGEEFAILLPGTGTVEAHQFAERLRQAVATKRVVADEWEIQFTVSIGIAGMQKGDLEPATILARADTLLYRAKATGRNRVASEELSSAPGEIALTSSDAADR